MADKRQTTQPEAPTAHAGPAVEAPSATPAVVAAVKPSYTVTFKPSNVGVKADGTRHTDKKSKPAAWRAITDADIVDAVQSGRAITVAKADVNGLLPLSGSPSIALRDFGLSLQADKTLRVFMPGSMYSPVVGARQIALATPIVVKGQTVTHSDDPTATAGLEQLAQAIRDAWASACTAEKAGTLASRYCEMPLSIA